MNLGLRDAVFLAPVLMEHLHASENSKATTPTERERLDKPLKKWGDWRHKQALTVIHIAKGVLSFATWKDEIKWYFGIIPVNWVKVRNFVMWFLGVTGLRARNPWKLSGLGNR